MPILTPGSPEIPSSLQCLDIDRLTVAIANAQRMAESTLGAGRPLALTEFKEILSVNKVMQTAQLSYWPIVNDPPPVVEVRQSTTLHYGRSLGTSQWHRLQGAEPILNELGTPTLDDEGNPTFTQAEYLIDEDGKLHLGRGFVGSGFGRSTPYQTDEVRVTYTSGFDFSVDTYEVGQIKTAIATIMQAQSSDQYKTNVLKVTIDKEASGSYGSSGGGGNRKNAIDILSKPGGLGLVESMMFLKKYAPRGML